MARDHIWTERGWLLLEYYRDDVVPDVSFALQLLRVSWTVRQKGGDVEQHFSASKYLVHRRITRVPVSSVQTSAIPIFLLKKNSTKIIFTINSINNWYTYIYILYPLWSLKSIFCPSKSRNSWKAGVICLFPKSCSSVTWPARWWRTPNLNLETKACSSYRAISVPAPEQTTGISVLTFSDSLMACDENDRK